MIGWKNYVRPLKFAVELKQQSLKRKEKSEVMISISAFREQTTSELIVTKQTFTFLQTHQIQLFNQRKKNGGNLDGRSTNR